MVAEVFINNVPEDSGRQEHSFISFSSSQIELSPITRAGLPGSEFYFKVRLTDGQESNWFGPVVAGLEVSAGVSLSFATDSNQGAGLITQKAIAFVYLLDKTLENYIQIQKSIALALNTSIESLSQKSAHEFVQEAIELSKLANANIDVEKILELSIVFDKFFEGNSTLQNLILFSSTLLQDELTTAQKLVEAAISLELIKQPASQLITNKSSEFNLTLSKEQEYIADLLAAVNIIYNTDFQTFTAVFGLASAEFNFVQNYGQTQDSTVTLNPSITLSTLLSKDVQKTAYISDSLNLNIHLSDNLVTNISYQDLISFTFDNIQLLDNRVDFINQLFIEFELDQFSNIDGEVAASVFFQIASTIATDTAKRVERDLSFTSLLSKDVISGLSYENSISFIFSTIQNLAPYIDYNKLVHFTLENEALLDSRGDFLKEAFIALNLENLPSTDGEVLESVIFSVATSIIRNRTATLVNDTVVNINLQTENEFSVAVVGEVTINQVLLDSIAKQTNLNPNIDIVQAVGLAGINNIVGINNLEINSILSIQRSGATSVLELQLSDGRHVKVYLEDRTTKVAPENRRIVIISG